MERMGCIFYLNPRDQISPTHTQNSSVPDNCYNHPVLVLRSSSEIDAVLILTSFSGRDLRDRHEHNPGLRSKYLPISPSPPHPDTGDILHLNSGVKLRKNSYVTLNGTYEISRHALRPYSRAADKTYQLTSDSWRLLHTKLGMPYIPLFVVSTPRQTSRRALADSYVNTVYDSRQNAHNTQPNVVSPPARVQFSNIRETTPQRSWQQQPRWEAGAVIASPPARYTERAPLMARSIRSDSYGTHRPSIHLDDEDRSSSPVSVLVVLGVVALCCYWFWAGTR